jgi:hypothetical protein
MKKHPHPAEQFPHFEFPLPLSGLVHRQKPPRTVRLGLICTALRFTTMDEKLDGSVYVRARISPLKFTSKQHASERT